MLYITKNNRLLGRKVAIQGGLLQFDAQGRIDLKEGQEFLIPVLRLVKLGKDGKPIEDVKEEQKPVEQKPAGPVFEQTSEVQGESSTVNEVNDKSVEQISEPVITDATSEVPSDNVSIESMTKAELTALCVEAGLPTNEYANLNKADLITYIQKALK